MKMLCPLTNEYVISKSSSGYYVYDLSECGNTSTIFICQECYNPYEIQLKSYPVRSLIANSKFPERAVVHFKSDCDVPNTVLNSERIVIDEFIRVVDYPKSAKEKADNLLISLYYQQKYDGDRFEVDTKRDPAFLVKNYFVNQKEYAFYINSLRRKNLIEFIDRIGDLSKIEVWFTYEGLNEMSDLSVLKEDSKICFIAMSFDPKTRVYREAIRKALIKTGYKIDVIDEKHINPDVTINDAIISLIKKCSFCIADFSYHSKGVYFESGFALGLGKKVIYTCEMSEFENAHFDIKPLQHILYETPEELTEKLINKIEAYID